MTATADRTIGPAVSRLLKRSRPRFWLYLAGPALVGFAYGATSVADLRDPLTVVLMAYFLLPANVYLYGINDIFDADIDQGNPKKGNREIRYSGETLTLLAVVVCGALGLGVLVLVPPGARPWLAGFLVLATAYSAPPLRLKVRPPLDSASNGLYVLPGVVAYATVAGTEPPLLVLLGGWFWTLAMHTFSAIPDIGPDRRAGIATTATVLGASGALTYCFCCWFLAALLMGVVDPRAGLLFSVYPLFLAGLVAGDVPVDRAYWWFPSINAGLGMILTLGGLWGLVHV